MIDQSTAEELLDALEELTCVLGLTAIKYKEQHAILQVSFDKARAVIMKARPPMPTSVALSRAYGGGDDLMKTLVDICRPVRS